MDNGANLKNKRTLNPNVAAPETTCKLVVTGDFPDKTVNTPKLICQIKRQLRPKIVLWINGLLDEYFMAAQFKMQTIIKIKNAQSR